MMAMNWPTMAAVNSAEQRLAINAREWLQRALWNGVTTADEGCDDGNIRAGDGCSGTCWPEIGFSCRDGACQRLPDCAEVEEGLPCFMACCSVVSLWTRACTRQQVGQLAHDRDMRGGWMFFTSVRARTSRGGARVGLIKDDASRATKSVMGTCGRSVSTWSGQQSRRVMETMTTAMDSSMRGLPPYAVDRAPASVVSWVCRRCRCPVPGGYGCS